MFNAFHKVVMEYVLLFSMSMLIFFYIALFCIIVTMTFTTVFAVLASLPALVAVWIVGSCVLVILISSYCECFVHLVLTLCSFCT